MLFHLASSLIHAPSGSVNLSHLASPLIRAPSGSLMLSRLAFPLIHALSGSVMLSRLASPLIHPLPTPHPPPRILPPPHVEAVKGIKRMKTCSVEKLPCSLHFPRHPPPPHPSPPPPPPTTATAGSSVYWTSTAIPLTVFCRNSPSSPSPPIIGRPSFSPPRNQTFALRHLGADS